MIDLTRLVSAAVVALALISPGAVARAQTAAPPAAASQNLWDTMRAGTFGVLEYGAGMVRSVTGWLVGGGGPEEVKAEDIRGLLNLSDKEFREFETQVRAAGYVLQGYSFGLNGGSEVELVFDFERVIGDRERADLRHLLDQQGGAAGAVRRSVLLGLVDATKYVDASPASGYRMSGVTMRLGPPLDVRVRFRRMKP